MALASMVVGFEVYNTFIVTEHQYTELRLEKQAVNVVKDSVMNMFYQPNSAVDIIKIPDDVYLRIYSNDEGLHIEAKYYYEVVPNVVLANNPVMVSGGTLIVKRVTFDNTTNKLKIEITK